MTTRTKTQIDHYRRQAVLEHLARYRMTVLAAVQQLPDFQRLGRKRTAAFLHQLCRSRELGHAPLYRNRRYFFLESRGFDRFAASCHRASTLTDTDRFPSWPRSRTMPSWPSAASADVGDNVSRLTTSTSVFQICAGQVSR